MERLQYEESRNLTDKSKQRVYPGVRASLFNGLTLQQYVTAKKTRCSEIHNNVSCSCQPLIDAATIVLSNRFTPLTVLWNKVFPGILYDCEILYVYISQKKEKVDYSVMMNELSQSLPSSQSKCYISSSEFFDILESTESDAERTLLKHVVCSGYNLSKRQAHSKFKISRMKERAIAVSEACQKAKQIKALYMHLAKIEQKAFLTSQGIDFDEYLDVSSSDNEDESKDSEEDSSEDDQCELVDENISSPVMERRESECGSQKTLHESCNARDMHNTNTDQVGEHQDSHYKPLETPGKNLKKLGVESELLLDILREADFNCRFAFVTLLQPRFENQGYTDEVLDHYLLDFVTQLPNLGLKMKN